MIARVPLWLSGSRTLHSLCADVGTIPGFTQWVKEPVVPQAACRLQMWLQSGIAMAEG